MSEQPLNPTPAEAPDDAGTAAAGSTAADAVTDEAEATGSTAADVTADEAAALRAASFERARRLRMEPRFPGGPAADPAGSHHERRIRSFQPRRSRVTTGQQESLERLWPKWGLDIDGKRVLDLTELFDGLPVVLEIGFGMGEATAQMAADDPGTGILAVDVHTPGQGNLLGLADRAGSTNVRVANGDAVILLREMLAPESLDGLRVYFPDPWPKARHHKRRLIQPEFLDLVAPVLKPGAIVHCATDWEPYAEQMLEVLTAHPRFANTAADGGYAPRPAFRPLTRFEGQGLDKGHVVHDLLFARV
ncbi:tRNA (guanosine(46)-N7)-methyltransferase TrmB [Streptomyces sp. JUS-F4]|uniref:tRNA (guanosine(46)-N7)-methyltransferase TrmB n=1 Tax=Streptomyces TaxID=1883 RepID=UPI0004AAB4FD|nr:MULTISPECIES: tRNA (guanosine(46)-N7)-methyltransferase TrmB [Streptomyces]MCX4709948.1 tRNA (guanosine(46)-N7)-methyltransferase TrmB [Streptomyces griseus]MDX2669666.1 tRNA (guanosine(46)-N7)-methyltransferase TrmB [Streptomyces sp. NRRL_ISP-5395]WKN15736.1 tRNA (guanosine(46)-N7)-methyltransferase TrmB [Streptomyces sp. JUS-F4]GHF90475.1 tRNA (guanine-N(7)-)-methyltransferase [Streptomyces griseus]